MSTATDSSPPSPPPAPASPGRRRTRLRLAAVIAVALAAVGVLAASGLDENLVFYRTPTELMRGGTPDGERVRLGGLVVDGSVEKDRGVVRFTLTDGVTDVPVVYTGRLVGVFQPGQNALVEGTLGPQGVFHGERLMVKHSNSYRGPDGQTYTPPPTGGENQ